MTECKGIMHDKLLEQYKISWRKLHPNQLIPLTLEGLPVDHSHDPHYPCPGVPWLADFLSHDPFTGEHFLGFFGPLPFGILRRLRCCFGGGSTPGTDPLNLQHRGITLNMTHATQSTGLMLCPVRANKFSTEIKSPAQRLNLFFRLL